jgi:hypothetical protein
MTNQTDVDSARGDVSTTKGAFLEQFASLKLTKLNYFFILVSLCVTTSAAYFLFVGHSPSVGQAPTGPTPTETIPVEPGNVTPLDSSVDGDLRETNEIASSKLENEIQNNTAPSGAGTRIVTDVFDANQVGEGYNLDGLEEIYPYEPSLDDFGGGSFYQEPLDVSEDEGQGNSPSTSSRPPPKTAVTDEAQEQAQFAVIQRIAEAPSPKIYTRKKAQKPKDDEKPLESTQPPSASALGADERPTGVPDGSERIASGLYTNVYAVNIHALNSDISGSAILEVISEGALKGARLNASYERLEWTDLMRLSVTSMTLKSGERVSVNAIVLDAQTSLAAISGEVDNHYLYRYGWWGVGSTLSSLGAGVEAYSSTATLTNGGVVQSASDLNATEKALVAAGSVGSDIGEVMKKNLDRPPTITLEPYQEFGVFFIDDVFIKAAP